MIKKSIFDDVYLSNESRDSHLKKSGIMFFSFVLHSIIIFFILFGPLIKSETKLPELKIIDVYLSIIPKPPSTMRGAKNKTQKKTKLVEKKKKIIEKKKIPASALIVPIEIPGEIIDYDDELFITSDIDFGIGGGTEGGTEGGHEGGIIGGSPLGDVLEEEIEPVRVNIGDIKLLKNIKPIYPPIALKKRIKGDVIIELTTGAFGKVKKWRVIDGHPILSQSAIDAVRQWIYKPYLVRGKPTPIKVTILVNFNKANY